MKDLIEKYQAPVPRYTSYPTVPNWVESNFSTEAYLLRMREAFAVKATGSAAANNRGMALYIHLPYCESLCTYCGCNTRITVNHKVEGPYIDAVIAEWKMYLNLFAESAGPNTRPLIREIHLGGGTPTFFAAAQLERMVSSILAYCDVSPDASYSFEAHPANTTLEHLETLYRLGFDRLSLGVQDFDPAVQKAIHRFQSAEEVMRVTEQARAIGYRSINYDLVYGLPFQMASGFGDTVAQVIAMRPDRIALYSYAHVPWKHPGQRAYGEADLPEAEAKLALFTAGRDAFMEAGYLGIGLDHFALPGDSLSKAFNDGSLHRNFMGYTDLRTDVLIGLGVSSISDVGRAYAQNAKSVEAYRERVMEGKWPIVKGHLLDPEEQFIGKHILNLMCQHETSWENSPAQEKAYMASRLPQLAGLETDGLVEICGKRIKVTPKGQVLVRNVCAAIDKYFVLAEEKRQFAGAI